MAIRKTVLVAQVVEDRCPQCHIEGEKKFDYGNMNWKNEDSELSEVSIYQEVTCSMCGLNFKQWYKARFVGQQVMFCTKGKENDQ